MNDDGKDKLTTPFIRLIETNSVVLRPNVTYLIENVNAPGKFLSIVTPVSGIENGLHVQLGNDADSAYAHWQLQFVDGYARATDSYMRFGEYYANVTHVHSGIGVLHMLCNIHTLSG